MAVCAGSLRALLLYDIAEEIDLNALGRQLGSEPSARAPGFKLMAPGYVRFERPPILEPCEPLELATGTRVDARLRYFDYGVVSVEFEVLVRGTWQDVITLSARWIETAEIEQQALALVRSHVRKIEAALRKPYAEWLDESYYVVSLNEIRDSNDHVLSAAQLLTEYGREISQVIRSDAQPLAESEEKEVLSSSMSYYPSDLLVVGWQAAIVYDTPQGSAPILELIEYANAQLLEYRRYDEILTSLLRDARAALEHRGGFFSRWRLARAAEHLNRLRLEIMELAERTDTAIKFLSDMYYARAYRMAAAKVGVNDYRALVDHKLAAAGELYEFMVNEFREARSFLLELIIVVILLIELLPFFRPR
jgi:hypothetical protein